MKPKHYTHPNLQAINPNGNAHIETDVAIWPHQRGQQRPNQPRHSNHYATDYPYREMSVGDSFVCKLNVRYNLSTVGNRLNMRFASRQLNENQIRVWRIE